MIRFLLVWVLCLSFSTTFADESSRIVADFLMGTDPKINAIDKVRDFRKDFGGLWQQALQRPEADYQRMAAETVARAHEYGIPSLTELVPDLEAILTRPTSHPTARYAAARALIVLDHRESSQKLLDAGQQYGSDLRQLVEPALATWDFSPARAVWNDRLSQQDVFPRDLILALRCMGTVRDNSSLEAMKKLTSDIHQPVNIRLEAASSAGQIAESGLETVAEQLANDDRRNPVINRLCAIRLLSRHSSDHTLQILIALSDETDATVVATAMHRILEVNPDQILHLAEGALRNADSRVRQAAVRACDLRPDAERLTAMAPLLADDHPKVRETVCSSFCRLAADPQFNESIRSLSMGILAGDQWRGQIQATLVLGTLGHDPAGNRMVELLKSPRADVRIHAAWGLRKLEIPETIPAILSEINHLTEARRKGIVPGVDEQVAHLLEACARMKVMEASDIFLMYVQKEPVPGDNILCRCAASWGLGHLYEGSANEAISEVLIERVVDDADQPRELDIVKHMAVLSLARMKAVQEASSLKASLSLHPPASALDVATRWAFHELTGEKLPDPEIPRLPDGRWFLDPADP